MFDAGKPAEREKKKKSRLKTCRDVSYLRIVFLDPSDTCDLCESRQGSWVVSKGVFIRR